MKSSEQKSVLQSLSRKLNSNHVEELTENYKGRTHYKFITRHHRSYKVECFTFVEFSHVSTAAFNTNHHLLSLQKGTHYDCLEEIGGSFVMSKFVLVETHTSPSLDVCRNIGLSYKESQLVQALLEDSPQLLNFSEVQFRDYRLLPEKYLVNEPSYSLDQVEEDAGFGAVVEVESISNARQYAETNFSGCLTSYKLYSAWAEEIRFKVVATPFVVCNLNCFVTPIKSQSNNKCEKTGRIINLSALFMEAAKGKQLLRVGSYQDIRSLVRDLFSGEIPRSRNIYEGLFEGKMNSLFERCFIIAGYDPKQIEQQCKPGDMLYINRWHVYDHVSVYLGNGDIIHVRSEDVQRRTNSIFRIDTIHNFCQCPNYFKIKVRRPCFFPFSHEETLKEAQIFSAQSTQIYNVHYNNCETNCYRFLTGKPFSTQAGVRTFLFQPIVTSYLSY